MYGKTNEKTYIAIDLKSFYASVECMDRGLDPMKTNLLVADAARTEKTICLAVSPALKAYGISGRARLFEAVQKIKEVNAERLRTLSEGSFKGESYNDDELKAHPELAVTYITAPPQMARYVKKSTEIHEIYLKYIAPEDMHVYSIDEVFMDVSAYLNTYKMTARQLAMKMILDVLNTTGITATAGIGSNLYLAKVAMDVMAKHIPADENGVRIAQLDEMSYRENLWEHRPITDFWRVGRGYAATLSKHGMYTMGDVALCSGEPAGEELLYRLFGVNAELLIDHAWGWEPCTMENIKNYRAQANSLCHSQVLKCPYTWEKARLIVREMAETLSLDLVRKQVVTKQLVLTVGYDIENLEGDEAAAEYKGEIKTDRYGRKIPKHGHGTVNLDRYTASTRLIMKAVLELYDRITNPKLLVRRMSVTAAGVIGEGDIPKEPEFHQLSFFDVKDPMEEKALEKEKKIQQAAIDIKKRFGKNAILKGMDLEEGATTIERNGQIGGHKA